MYKLLIADDEEIILQGIKESIDWNSYNVAVVGTALDGKKALELTRQTYPDIIITDIRMPEISGLELVEEIVKTQPDIKIILITAYQEFGYAQRAVNLGVQSFLTKPLSKKKIIEEVLSAIKKISSERAWKAEKEKLESTYQMNLPLLREHFLNSLIMGKVKKTECIGKYLKEYSIEISLEHAGVFVLRVDEDYDLAEDIFNKGNQIKYLEIIELIKRHVPEDYTIAVFQSYSNEIVTIFSPPLIGTDEINDIIDICNKIKEVIAKQLEIFVSIGIGRIYFSIEQISSSYFEAVKALKYRLVYTNKNVLYIEDVEMKEKMQLNIFCELNNLLTSFRNTIEEGIEDNAVRIVENITRRLTNNPSVPYYYIQQVYCQLLSTLLGIVSEMGISPEEITEKPVSKLYSEIFEKHSFEDINRWYTEILENTCKIIILNKKNRVNNIITKAISYMRMHCHEDISLMDVSDYVGLNHYYFSRFFKEKTGIHFIEYLKNLRIEKAKELLRNTNKKVYEISEELGYQSVQYFSALFKNTVGMTPLEYKYKG